MNKIILIGRLTKDPGLQYTPAGNAVCSFTLAVDRPFTNQAGEREADFINIVAWNKKGENAAQYLKKGKQTAAEGRLQIRSYEASDGQKRWVTEVIADRVEFIGPRDSNKPPLPEPPSAADGFGQEIDFNDAEVPF